MSLVYENGEIMMSPGIYDIHGHPRVFDPLPNGKAGLVEYTETALRSGITLINFMPNESIRIPSEEGEFGTELIQLPISNYDRAEVMAMSVRTQSRIMAGFNVGVEVARVTNEDRSFNARAVGQDLIGACPNSMGLKLWVDESTGGQTVSIEHGVKILDMWDKICKATDGIQKVATIHAEDGNVRTLIETVEKLENGKDIKLHIAHVSSKQELEAIIDAKERGMNVTCEVTPHHLFVTEEEGGLIGGYGCMKPSLKKPEDVKFLWENMRYIDIIASDCAPHRKEEKEAEKPAFGVTNHTVMMPLLFGAVEEDRITMGDLYDKLCVKPRQRFNLPEHDGTLSMFNLGLSYDSTEHAERMLETKYGQNIFLALEEVGKKFHLAGRLAFANSGLSYVNVENDGSPINSDFNPSMNNLITS